MEKFCRGSLGGAVVKVCPTGCGTGFTGVVQRGVWISGRAESSIGTAQSGSRIPTGGPRHVPGMSGNADMNRTRNLRASQLAQFLAKS